MLDYALRGLPFVPPAGQFVGLHTGDPEDGGAEVSGPAYQRQPIQFNDQMQQANRMEFPALSPTTQDVTHYAVYDNPIPGQGKRLFSEQFTGQTFRLRGGETVALAPGAITVV